MREISVGASSSANRLPSHRLLRWFPLVLVFVLATFHQSARITETYKVPYQGATMTSLWSQVSNATSLWKFNNLTEETHTQSQFVTKSSLLPMIEPPSFSACLAWLDDRERLIEWLAYHYHVLRMRYVVISRDVKSEKSLEDIVQRWTGRMEIVVWDDPAKILPTSIWSIYRAINDKEKQWRFYQKEFFRHCALHLQARNRTWTAFLDTDEFVVFDARYVKDVEGKMKAPGSILELILHEQQLNQSKHYHSKFQAPCIPLVRRQFGPVESPPHEVERNYPEELRGHIEPERLQTLRFRHGDNDKLVGKCLADVSRLNFEYPKVKVWMHKLLETCEHVWGHGNDPLVVNHYLGSWEAFQRPHDPRHADRYKKWTERGSTFWKDKGPLLGDEIRAWLQGFVDEIGDPSEVRGLLDGVGFPKNASTALPEYNASCPGLCIRNFELQD